MLHGLTDVSPSKGHVLSLAVSTEAHLLVFLHSQESRPMWFSFAIHPVFIPSFQLSSSFGQGIYAILKTDSTLG